MQKLGDIKLEPENKAAPLLQAKFIQGVTLHGQGKLADAEHIYVEILQCQPLHFGALHLLGLIACQTRQTERGVDLIRKAISLNPKIANAHSDLGNALLDMKRAEEALVSFDTAIALQPDFAPVYNSRGIALKHLKRAEEALASFDNAIALQPDFVEVYNNRGNALLDLKRAEEAVASFDKAIALQPDFVAAYNNRGNALLDLNRAQDALASFDMAIELKPDFAEAHSARGDALQDLGRQTEALTSYDNALQLQPNLAEAWLGRGNVLYSERRYEEAIDTYDKAIARKADLEGAWVVRGNVLNELKRYGEALDAYDKALALNPDLTDAWLGRGDVFNRLKRHNEAAQAYVKGLNIDPDFPGLKGMILHQKMLFCDWKGIGKLVAEIDSDLNDGRLSAEPFGWQGVANSERSLQLCAELHSKKFYPANVRASARRPITNSDKIRIGYLSGEFREQATSFLLVGILEHHDNSRFEIYAFDNGWDDQSKLRARINGAVHSMINIRHVSDAMVAAAICENKIDILVNLNGYFGEPRTSVFALRPAPIQVNYLGFPGTLGANYMDYIIADQHVIPAGHKIFYTEKVVHLPNCYQANDTKKEIGTRVFNRAEFGLPEKHFVFCCFNKCYKIIPDTFDCWMQILKQVEGSVIWLLEDNAAAANNLRKEAAIRGVNSERLVFAKRMSLPDHLARHQLADLFLDTLPYNAHTTASDALWAGLPVLTHIGETFAGRVAASLLNAIRLPELITTTSDAYEQMAIDLATHPEKLAAIKSKLAENRLTTPLFDTKLFTKHIERAYASMYARYEAGLPPDHIGIEN
jgi:protein O-GlcNAc transferase